MGSSEASSDGVLGEQPNGCRLFEEKYLFLAIPDTGRVRDVFGQFPRLEILQQEIAIDQPAQPEPRRTTLDGNGRPAFWRNTV